VLARVAQLDQQQGVSPHWARVKQGRLMNEELDEMALAQLVSMGVHRRRAMRALRASRNNVERAQDWLTEHASADDDDDDGGTAQSSAVAAVSPETVAHPPGSDASNCNNPWANVAEAGAAVGQTAGVTMDQDVEKDGFLDHDDDDDEANNDADEESPMELLERVLGQVLGTDDTTNKADHDILGNSLDEEWEYIQKYRSAEN